MNWKNKKVAVTGAGGFIGSHLTEELVKSGARVRALVHYNSRNDWGQLESIPEDTKNKLDIFQGDICDQVFVREFVKGQDIIFHLAALISIPYSYSAASSFFHTNVIGLLNILEAARAYKPAKIIHTSTSEVYGSALYTPIDEKHPLQAQSPYSASKIAADKLAESYYCSHDVPVCIIRPFNTFGPRQSAKAIIPTIISQLIAGKDTVDVGNLDPVRDFTYVKDTVSGFIRIAESNKAIGEVINIGSGKGISMRDLLSHIMILTDTKIKVCQERKRHRPPKSEVLRLICANRKSARLTGWRPQTDFTEGLQETISYIRDNIGTYKYNAFNI